MIILDSVTKKFGAFTAVDNVSYSIQKGEFFALLGPNGAGKTTIVRMLLNFTTPSSGSVTTGYLSDFCKPEQPNSKERPIPKKETLIKFIGSVKRF